VGEKKINSGSRLKVKVNYPSAVSAVDETSCIFTLHVPPRLKEARRLSFHVLSQLLPSTKVASSKESYYYLVIYTLISIPVAINEPS
jgi:hypothetical protein